jgi:hypothetical protein
MFAGMYNEGLQSWTFRGHCRADDRGVCLFDGDAGLRLAPWALEVWRESRMVRFGDLEPQLEGTGY